MRIKKWLIKKLGLKKEIEASEDLMKTISEGMKKGLAENIPELRERQADERNRLK